jgi:hypothetical protein
MPQSVSTKQIYVINVSWISKLLLFLGVFFQGWRLVRRDNLIPVQLGNDTQFSGISDARVWCDTAPSCQHIYIARVAFLSE